MDRFLTQPWLKAYSGLSINLSAGYFAAVFIVQGIEQTQYQARFLILTLNIVLGIVFLLLTVWCERRLEK